MKKIVDGNSACSRIAYLFSEICSIYPITPSSPMAANIDALTNTSLLNLFNDKPKVVEMESEAGAAGAFHGALLSGSLASTFTASQGLLLMIPNMYKIAGEMLPGVIHVASRSIATHALSIFGDHQDIYATRSTGFCILASSSVEDAQNLAAVAHLSAIKGSLPFLHFFDGFRTSHELNTIDELKVEDLLSLIDYEALNKYKKRCLNIGCDKQFGMAQNEDIYFQTTEARNLDYLAIPNIVEDYMAKINYLTKSDYKPFNYYGSKEATNVIIAMGSVCDTIKKVVNKLKNVGLVEVHLYRPFSAKHLTEVLPKSVKNIAVLDRTKEFGSIGEPLYLDVCSVLKDKNINVVGGRYGLSSKNTTVEDIYSIYKMLETKLQNNFTIGINDDVTNLSLEKFSFNIEEDALEIKIYGFGSDGMVSASKDLLKIIHEKNSKYVQGYFEYDSKKSGGVTVSNLRISDKKIKAPYYITNPSLIVVTKDRYFQRFDILSTIKKNGILLINTTKNNQELNDLLTNQVKKIICEKNIKVYYINAENLAFQVGLSGKVSKIMETLILKLLDVENALEIVKDNVKKEFATKGDEVVNQNLKAIDLALENLQVLEIISAEKEEAVQQNLNVLDMINARRGNEIPVSELLMYRNGAFPAGTTRFEKRNISTFVPKWISENCIQCGMCSLSCPHAVIRSVANESEGISFIGQNDLKYNIVISEKDCTGCGLCVNVCPGKSGNKALEMIQKDQSEQNEIYFEEGGCQNPLNKFTIKGSQLQKPLFEFSGACAGCGQTPYIKLLTQLFQEKLVIANATGCSSIYGGSVPSTPYRLPWANSLFEDNAQFALGIHYSYQQKRNRIASIMQNSLKSVDEDVKNLFEIWLNNQNDSEKTLMVQKNLNNKLIPKELEDLKEYIPARTVWAVGGDGWAYDIGYGGLDHLLHSNENIKVLVLDTEVYSNTGGQASKATNLGAVAEFANFGKRTSKKDLFKIAMSIPNCYVATVCLHANMMQTIKAFEEADKHTGPAIIIAYCPCIEQGIKTGMSHSNEQQILSVACGYNILMRYNESLKIDSKEPNFDLYDEFLNNEIRYNALKLKDENFAKQILNEQKQQAIKRYNYYKNLEQNKTN
ncbi:MAG: pyruvate:ferredoxin (flavodoxin) oxidoreductase [Firmicutes bacterium]|nr:pyruvate:ferredoxin (flavodoxin) oxidoreductase [Bacillota bacterium]